MSTHINKRVAVITGDVTIDWNLACHRPEGERVRAPWSPEDEGVLRWQPGGAAMLAELVQTLAYEARVLVNKVNGHCDFEIRKGVKYPRIDEKLSPQEESYHHSFALWSPNAPDERFRPSPVWSRAKAGQNYPDRSVWRVNRYLGCNLKRGFDLQLMPQVSDARDIPTRGKNLVIVADVQGKLHFRIFDADGNEKVKKDETSLTAQAENIEDLKNQLERLWPPNQPTRSEKEQVIIAVTSIVAYTPKTLDINTEDLSLTDLPAHDHVIVIDDLGFGFRDNEDLWKPLFQHTSGGTTRPNWWVILQTSGIRDGKAGRLLEYLLHKCPERLIVVLAVDDLRSAAEVRIPSGLSWERTMEDLARELPDLDLPLPEIGKRFDLRLVSPVSVAKEIPTRGKNLVIVADVQGELHFRIFDADGTDVVKTHERSLPNQREKISALKERLKEKWSGPELTRLEKDKVITDVTSIVNYSLDKVGLRCRHIVVSLGTVDAALLTRDEFLDDLSFQLFYAPRFLENEWELPSWGHVLGKTVTLTASLALQVVVNFEESDLKECLGEGIKAGVAAMRELYLSGYRCNCPKCRRFDLQLMPEVSDDKNIPTEGKNLVIVADVQGKLHFRIFDADGNEKVKKDEASLAAQAENIKDLKNQLERLWPPNQPTRSEEYRVITAVTSIVGYTHGNELPPGYLYQKDPKDHPPELIFPTEEVAKCLSTWAVSTWADKPDDKHAHLSIISSDKLETREFNSADLQGIADGAQLSSSWTILEQLVENGNQGGSRDQNWLSKAEHIAILGLSSQSIPMGRFGELISVDRDELEALRSIQGLIRSYPGGSQKTPLNLAVFGPPGSGKSFAVQEVASSVFRSPKGKQTSDCACGETESETIKFDLSQFKDPTALTGALHQVHDVWLLTAAQRTLNS